MPKIDDLITQLNAAVEEGTFSLTAIRGVADLKARAEQAEARATGLTTQLQEAMRQWQVDKDEKFRVSAAFAEAAKKHGDLLAREQKVALVEQELKLRTEFQGKIEGFLSAFLRNPTLKFSGYTSGLQQHGPQGQYGGVNALPHEARQETE